MYTYGDIPDDVRTKQQLPLLPIYYNLYKTFGFERLNKFLSDFSLILHDWSRVRLNESIYTAKDLISGKISAEEAEKTFSYCFFPPIIALRLDLLQGFMKLVFGDGSMSFIGFDEQKLEVTFIMTVHCNNGYPIDWFVIGSDINDEVFDRRHIKRGIKLRDIPKKAKNMNEIGKLAKEILLDVRNERNPEFSDNPFTLGLVWGSGGLEAWCKTSNFELLSMAYDSGNGKRLYNLPMGNIMTYWPLPSLLKTLLQLDRGSFIKKLAGMSSKEKLVFQPIEEEVRQTSLIDKIPDILEFMKHKWDNLGIPTPRQSVGCIPPNIKDKKSYLDEDKLLFKRPIGEKITLDKLNITFDEALNGMYLDIETETPDEEISREKILSKGWGRNTKFL
jgi:hypothetical protein